MHVVAVVPIFMSAGAAVLPTVVAAATSVIAILFKPRELVRLCRRRPVAMSLTGFVLLLSLITLIWWIETPAKVRPLVKGPTRTDWARVASDIIAQAPLHSAAAIASTPPPITPPPASTAASVTSANLSQDFTRSLFQGGTSPAKLAPLWAYRPEGTMFISTPAVSGKRIFAAGCAADLGGYTGIIACLDADTGKKIWEVADLNDDVLKPFFSSPAVTADGKYVLIGQGLHQDRDCQLYCFDAATGKLKWGVKTPLHIESSPAIYGDLAVVGAGAIEGRDGMPTGDPGYVFAVRISDGKELWRQPLNDPESAPAIDDAGMVYIGSGFNGTAVAAIRSETDEVLKAKGLPRLAWKTSVDYPVTGPVTLAGDRVIVGGGNSDLVHSNANARGQVLALDRKTGAILWKTPVEDSVLGSISCRDDMLMCPSRTGEVIAMSAKDGQILWRTRISGNSPVIAGCPFTDQRVYALSSDGTLAALDPKTGVILEKLFVNDQAKPGSGLSTSSPLVAFGHLIVGTETGGLRCIAGAQTATGGGGGYTMITTSDFIHELAECRDVALVGGKGANLGRLVRAGFPVPTGFVIDTRAYHHARQAASAGTIPDEIPAEVIEEITSAYRAMGQGPVAVRSSATAEDMAAASMAGQYETFLDIEGEEALLEKVRHCWASLDTPRIRAYLIEHGIDQTRVAMAVVVQRLVPSDVAGVLFTINPNANGRTMKEMLIEASWGLGESVVGGRVQPDVLRLERETGKILEAVIADKKVTLAAGAHEERAVEESLRRQACLADHDVQRLWELGRHAAAHFGAPQDIEWAIHNGQLFLLQSRPITTHLEAEAQEEVLQATQAELKTALAAGRGPWALHNLAETLAHPTPLTWSVIRQFMSGSGGFGAMYRMVGFAPSPLVCRDGFLDRVAGRIFMDASRAPEMFFENFPFTYDLEELKRSPDASQSPPTLPRGSLKARMNAGKRLAAVSAKLRTLSEDFDRTLREVHFPELVKYVHTARQTDLTKLTAAELITLWQKHETRVLGEFAPLSLMPSLICGMALGELRQFLAENLWEEDPDALAQLLSAGGLANRTVMADAELYEVAKGDRTLESWLADHGHRAAGEFDLAAPRWREQPSALHDMAQRLLAGGSADDRPLERHRRTTVEVTRRMAELRALLPEDQAVEFGRRMDLVRRYVPFREDGKDYLMLGYDLLRRLALEAGRRLNLGEDVFYLTRDELFEALRAGSVSLPLIEQRQRTHRAEAKVSLPNVLDAQVAQTLGQPPEALPTTGGHKAFSVSSGITRGRALILHSPTDVPAGGLEKGYILICPSTDPSWTPLFVNAAGLILECGGTLSHGAVVAREMGLPAVVVPDATRMFKDGEEIIVDGTRGWIGRVADQAEAEIEAVDPNDTHISHLLVPPPPGPQDRSAGKLRNLMAAIWSIFVLAFFLLPPAWVSTPTLAFLDILLWPLVRSCGKPATVALVAAAIAVITLLLQRFLTDNRRLLVAKHRAAALTRQADVLPPDSARRKAMLALAAPVQLRMLLAALVPVGLLLGPMVLPFAWFSARVEPSMWNAAPGTGVQIVAYVDADTKLPITIQLPAALTLDSQTPATVTLPAIRPTLERLLTLYRQTPAQQQQQQMTSWETNLGPDLPWNQAAADLQNYLNRGIPPQPIRWRVTTPRDFSGYLPVSVLVGDQPPVTATMALGDKLPPTTKSIAATGAVRQVQLLYDRPQEEPVFWKPFGWLAGHDGLPLAGKLSAWDMGWVWLYILAYLPVLFIVRALLRVA